MAVVDADVGGRWGGEHLALVLEGIVCLDDGDGEVTGGFLLLNARPSLPPPPRCLTPQTSTMGLMTMQTKGIKGKGVWYWAHLEPILV
ncbi:hypothetical protein COCNU_scaffold012933G000060 [Cocos nucifera]|nr:hypothetical protein [Cocos nucifera]